MRLLLTFLAIALSAAEDIDFNRDIRPILSENCFFCHGPDDDHRKAKLRLDTREGALKAVIVPGQSAESEAYARILSQDEDEQMPPAESGKSLDPEEKDLIRRWIDAGAPWQGHWAFESPTRDATIANPIDHFVRKRLSSANMEPTSEASRETLIRRVSLDLRGLPPSLAEIDAFLSDGSADAYAAMVDRMLDSPHFGEKLATIWMDLARYGDTNGYHFDSTRPVWLWRDWVIDAFNANMPYDDFSIDQLAGDLHPNPTQSQLIASGFNRNSRFNEEGGADPDEWLVRYAIDRTSTLGQVWLGLTLSCAECHSHKYDPITQKEFYELYAFFNSLEEVGAGGKGGYHNKFVPPFISVETPDVKRRIAEAEAEIAAIDKEIRAEIAKIDYREPEAEEQSKAVEPREIVWVDDDLPAGAKEEGDGWTWVDTPVKSGRRAMKRVSKGNQQHFFSKASATLKVGQGDSLFAWIYLDPKSPPRSIMLQYNSTGVGAGWAHRGFWGEDLIQYGNPGTTTKRHMGDLPKTGEWVRLEIDAHHIGLKPGMTIHGMAFTQYDGTAYWDQAGIVSTTSPVDRPWVDDALPAGAKPEGNWVWENGPPKPQSGNRIMKRSGRGLHQHFFQNSGSPLVIQAGDVFYAHVWIDPKNPPETVSLQLNNQGNQPGWEHRAYWGGDKLPWGQNGTESRRRIGDLPAAGEWVRLEVNPADLGIAPGMKLHGMAFTQVGGTAWWDNFGIRGYESSIRSLKAWLETAANDKSLPTDPKALRDHFLEHVYADSRSIFDPLHQRKQAKVDAIGELRKNLPKQLVSKEMAKPRPAHVLIRGDFQKPGEVVQRNVPEIFPSLPDDVPRDRLALARWLMANDHPLTARVTVNRFWAQLFGRGIVETIGDFGTQGKYPTHPELLDWLAVEFVESGWDVKNLFRLIANSATYRQSSVNDGRYAESDPYNHLLSRAPRYRVSAEEIRDTTLHIAGMLSDKIGGEPVFPFQPRDYYRGKKGGWRWNLSPGDERYRRGMYTFWRRTTPYPAFMIFDAQDRSECVVARPRTNTPLQALTTLNEPLFVESARVFAQRILTDGSDDDAGRAEFAFRLATARVPSAAERSAILESLPLERAHFANSADAAKALIAAGDYQRAEGLDPVEHAAWTAIANALLNLDETITRE